MSQGRVAVPLVTLLALALAAVPLVVPAVHEEDALRGLVVDARGFGVAHAAVTLFAEDEGRALEEVRTDERGHFALHLDAPRPRVLVQPPVISGLAPAWSPAGHPSTGLRFVLRPAHPLVVAVTDADGDPVEGAEVRAYELRRERAVVDLAVTGPDGLCRLRVPPRVDVGVFAPGDAGLVRWELDRAVPAGGDRLELVLPPATTVRGRVRGAAGGLAGIVVTARSEAEPGGPSGLATSGADGAFELAALPGRVVLRVVDPSGTYLPARQVLDAPSAETAEVVLAPASPRTVVVRADGEGLPARVWTWEPGSATWAWSVETDERGEARVPTGERFGVHAVPDDTAYAPLAAWDVPPSERPLVLEAPD